MTTRERWESKFKLKEDSWVFVPTEETIQYGLKIKKTIEEKWRPPQYFYHLKCGGHVKALQQHLNNKYFIHLDIENFFGSINRSRVTRCIKELVPYEKAREIALESTVRQPEATIKTFILPFGFVQSPIIASVCLSKSALGHRLNHLSKRKDFDVSIYMDDIILSCNSSADLNEQLEIIEAAAGRSRLPLNKKKQEGPAIRVTAFNIHISQGLLKITNDRLGDFWETYNNSENKHQKAGILNYLLSVNQDQATTF
jgi:Reverse transcriptase (RNA-dependent DNA polymerase)